MSPVHDASTCLVCTAGGRTGAANDPVARAERIAADPDTASDVDKLRAVADLLDVLDVLDKKDGSFRGDEVQAWMRDLADRIQNVPAVTVINRLNEWPYVEIKRGDVVLAVGCVVPPSWVGQEAP